MHLLGLDRLRTAGAPLLASGPALVVDDDGWVAASHGVAVGSRIAVPVFGKPLAVPGLGACTPVRLAGGWLIRPSSVDRTVTLELDLTGTPQVRLTGGDADWRRTVTRRHAEILVLLHRAGPGGLSAEALSRVLYGDAEHVVTVRAEVSRLRRLLGGAGGDAAVPAVRGRADDLGRTVLISLRLGRSRRSPGKRPDRPSRALSTMRTTVPLSQPPARTAWPSQGFRRPRP